MPRVFLVILCAVGVLMPRAVVIAQQPRAELHVMPIRGNVSMIVGGGSNVAVSAGVDGMLLVDTGSATTADAMLAKVNEVGAAAAGAAGRMTNCVGPSCYPAGSSGPLLPFGWIGPAFNGIVGSPKAPKPIRWIVQTTVDPSTPARHRKSPRPG
jgi:hypothetical protein